MGQWYSYSSCCLPDRSVAFYPSVYVEYCRWLQESPSPRRLCDCFEKLDEQSCCGCCPRTSQLPATPGSEHKIDATRLQATACLIDVGTAVSSPSAVAATWTCR